MARGQIGHSTSSRELGQGRVRALARTLCRHVAAGASAPEGKTGPVGSSRAEARSEDENKRHGSARRQLSHYEPSARPNGRKRGVPQVRVFGPGKGGCPTLFARFWRKGGIGTTIALLAVVLAMPIFGQPNPAQPVVLDRVVAVVNNQPILLSDVDDAIRLSALDPPSEEGPLTPQRALDELIGRALIRQQMRREEIAAATPTPAEVEARLSEIRAELPECEKENCATQQGWEAFLAAHDLTAERVEVYLRHRMEILRFIEQRFRQGIRVSPQQVETYYHDTLLPQYAPGVQPPRLETVAPRIEEILLQQQVNALFDDWLKNLREQGDVEVLDPSLETTRAGAGAGEAEE